MQRPATSSPRRVNAPSLATRRALAAPTLLIAGVALTGCTDFATPAELAKPTILAVVAEPPLTPPGKQSKLELVLVDGNGRVATPAATWSLVETFPGVAPMGTIAAHGDGTATYTAPATPPPQAPSAPPPIDSVQIEVAAEPRPLTVIKGVAVVDIAATNPTLQTLTVDGADGKAGITVAPGAKVPLEVTIDPPAGDDATYAWYTTRGEIEDYQSQKSELVAPDAAGAGWLFVVVRDGRGGVAWHGAPLMVQ